MEVASCSPSAIPAGRTVQLLLTQFGGRDPCPAAADPRRNAINTDGISQLCCAAPAPCASRCGCYQGTRLPSARQGGPAVTACTAPTDNPQPRLSLRWLQRVPLAARSPGGSATKPRRVQAGGGLSLFPQPPRAPQLAPVPLPTGRPQQPSGFARSPGSGELLSPSPCSPLPTPGLGAGGEALRGQAPGARTKRDAGERSEPGAKPLPGRVHALLPSQPSGFTLLLSSGHEGCSAPATRRWDPMGSSPPGRSCGSSPSPLYGAGCGPTITTQRPSGEAKFGAEIVFISN